MQSKKSSLLIKEDMNDRRIILELKNQGMNINHKKALRLKYVKKRE